MKFRLLCFGLVVVALAGCASGEQQEIDAWISQTKSEVKPSVKPLPEPKKFVPEAYTQIGAVDPYDLKKLTAALKREQSQSSKLLQDELKRTKKDPLEAFPLDGISMVGSLARSGATVALLKGADNLLYQARVGNYIGQSFGKITAITETEVQLREIAQDATGEWIERKSTLQLQESKK